PVVRGIRSVSKYRGVTPDHCPTGRSPIGGIGRSPGAYGAIVVIVGGSAIVAAAPAAPGNVSSEGMSRSMNVRIAAGSPYCDGGSEMRIVNSPSGRNPTGT